jgi:hypothetical protein
MTLMKRDPFAREELHRTELPRHIGLGCEWCDGRNGNGKLYEYFVETDGGTKTIDNHLFCSADCRESYYA